MKNNPLEIQASTAMLMKSVGFWVITRRRVVFTDVSGQRIGPILTGQDSK
jgi:hypothetical protein